MLRWLTVQLKAFIKQTNELARWFSILMIFLYPFTVLTQCFVMIINIYHKLNLMMLWTLPLHTPHYILWICVIGVCLFCGHVLNRSWHFINEFHTTCSPVIANKFVQYLVFFYRNKFDPWNLETRGQDFWRGLYIVTALGSHWTQWPKLTPRIAILSIPFDHVNATDLTDNWSTLVQVMAWYCQTTSLSLSQCLPRFMSP